MKDKTNLFNLLKEKENLLLGGQYGIKLINAIYFGNLDKAGHIPVDLWLY